MVDLFSRHLEGDISASVCAEMEQHLTTCSACRARCDSLREVLGRCRTATEAVPAAVQREVRQAIQRGLQALGEPAR